MKPMKIKWTTQMLSLRLGNRHKPVTTDWTMHPSYIAGIEGIEAYGRWVSEVVMPIAFQWIEENKDEVYDGIPNEDLHDDVGVVIASAFELVKTLSSYQNGLTKAKDFEDAVANGTWDPVAKKINPLWAGIAKEVRDGTARTFARLGGDLKDTIR